MRALRLAAAPLALLLTLVVAGETTDLLPCADADCGVWSVLLDVDPAPADGPEGAPDAEPACLCHAAYVPPALPAASEAPRGPERALGAPPPAGPAASVGRVPYPPPRG
jgi:hypothetical protein